MSALRILGRQAGVIPHDWRDRLAARLGEKPRRLGLWTELALYGALRCMDDAKESVLPHNAGLILCTLNGAMPTLKNTLEEARAGFLPPFGFLQCQPSVTLATLAKHLSWRGDAVAYTQRDDVPIAQLVSATNNEAGVLLGWVEETPILRSNWVRLVPTNNNAGSVNMQEPALSLANLFLPHVAGGASQPS